MRCTLLIAIDDDGEAHDRGEKLVRESSAQYLQITSPGSDSYIDKELRILMKMK